MLLAYDYITSRSFWRSVYPPDRIPGNACRTPPLDCFACNELDVQRLKSDWVTKELLEEEDGRLHVLSFQRNARRSSESHLVRAWTQRVPDGAFFDLGTGAFVLSPEFIFLHIAATHSLAETIAYGDEICGCYSFDSLSESGLRQRLPLTNTGKLWQFISSARGLPGHGKAVRAITHLVENSASPMETANEMFACLPYRMGGYCLHKPEMNYPVELSPEAARMTRKSMSYIDLCWPNHLVGIEHQGRRFHAGETSFAADRARMNALREMGFEVIEMTGNQIADLTTFESHVLYIAKRIGKRIDRSKLGPTPERLALREMIFSWNRTGGCRRQAQDK